MPMSNTRMQPYTRTHAHTYTRAHILKHQHTDTRRSGADKNTIFINCFSLLAIFSGFLVTCIALCTCALRSTASIIRSTRGEATYISEAPINARTQSTLNYWLILPHLQIIFLLKSRHLAFEAIMMETQRTYYCIV